MKTYLLFLLTVVVVTAAPAAPSTSNKKKLQNGNLSENMPDIKHQKAGVFNNTTDPKRIRIMTLQLREIINNAEALKTILTKKVLHKWVNNVFRTENCTLEQMHEAGKVLAAFEAEVLGLKEEYWKLPRLLSVYTEGTHSRNTREEPGDIKLQELLDKIRHCAREYNSKLNTTSS